MIESKELRIGNLVYSPSGNVINVTATWIKEQAQCDVSNCEYLQPIPLNEEWLLKFGFERTYLSEFRSKFTHKDNRCSAYNFSSEHKSMQGFTWHGRYVKNIEYVHQLQNIYFSLIGEELTLSVT